MNQENKIDSYSLDEMIQRLEEIAKNTEGYLNYPKAFYSLALEIKNIKDLYERKEDDHHS